MSSLIGDGEIRGKLINEDVVRLPDGDTVRLPKCADRSMVGEQIVVRGETITRRIDS